MTGSLASDEQPVLAANRDRTHRPFGEVVVHRQVTVLDVSIECRPLVTCVSRRFANQALG